MLLEKAGAEVSCCGVGLGGECCNSLICLMSEVHQLQGITASALRGLHVSASISSCVWQERSRLWLERCFCSCGVSSLGISDLLLLFPTGAWFCQKNRRSEANVCGTQEQRKLFRGWLFALHTSIIFRNCLFLITFSKVCLGVKHPSFWPRVKVKLWLLLCSVVFQSVLPFLSCLAMQGSVFI